MYPPKAYAGKDSAPISKNPDRHRTLQVRALVQGRGDRPGGQRRATGGAPPQDQDGGLPAHPRRRGAGGRAAERRDRRGGEHPAPPGHHHRQPPQDLPLHRAQHPDHPAHVLHAPVGRQAQAHRALPGPDRRTGACARPSPPPSTPTRSSRACSTARGVRIAAHADRACTSASTPSLKPIKQDVAKAQAAPGRGRLPQRRRHHPQRPAGPLRARQGGGSRRWAASSPRPASGPPCGRTSW